MLPQRTVRCKRGIDGGATALDPTGRISLPPRPIMPQEPHGAGFVFKVQTNMHPQYRDRIAFVRLSSGRFQRGMKLKNVRTGRIISVQSPVFFLARERNLAGAVPRRRARITSTGEPIIGKPRPSLRDGQSRPHMTGHER